MPDRSHLSIGEVLSLLRDEFPDVTISKIRFLESQGLVDPERTPSGYRKFYDHDVERLRWILRQQREHFLPLKVIRGRLSEQGGDAPADDGAGNGNGYREDDDADGPAAEIGAPVGRAEPADQVSGGAGPAVSAGRGPARPGARPAVPSLFAALHTDDPGEARPPAPEGPAGRPGPTSGAVVAGPSGAPVAGPSGAPVAGPSGAPVAGPSGAPGAGSSGAPGAGRTPGPAAGPATPRPAPPAAPPTPIATPSRSTGPGAGGEASRNGNGAAPGDEGDHEPETYTPDELAAAAGADVTLVAELKQYGLIAPQVVAGTAYYDDSALAVARAAAGLGRHGVEVRHLRIWRNAADREADLFQQVVLPLLRQRNPQARRQAFEILAELSAAGADLRSALLQRALRDIR